MVDDTQYDADYVNRAYLGVKGEAEAEAYIERQRAIYDLRGRQLNRVMGKGEEARTALQHILESMDSGISLDALEAACRTIRSHIGE